MFEGALTYQSPMCRGVGGTELLFVIVPRAHRSTLAVEGGAVQPLYLSLIVLRGKGGVRDGLGVRWGDVGMCGSPMHQLPPLLKIVGYGSPFCRVGT